MNLAQQSLALHQALRGKIEIALRTEVGTREALSLAYTPGVAEPCLAIQQDPAQSFALTRRWNTVAVVTDGTAVLGLGDIGPEAGMPVMEGKCMLFKAFGDVDAIPLCVRSKDVDEIVRTLALLQGSFGGINLEDIAAPRCFEIERRLQEECEIPVFHDDQHGTAVVTLAALRNATQVVGKTLAQCRVVCSGAGAAGTAIAKLLYAVGVREILMCDRQGIVAPRAGLRPAQQDLLAFTNPQHQSGTLADALRGADVFVGVSAPGLVTTEMVRSMHSGAIVLAMANPEPEILPELAKAGGAVVVGTGRSDFANQINNVLAFPGMFRGALDARAKRFSEAMKLAAAEAIAALVPPNELHSECILPQAFDARMGSAVAQAVFDCAKQEGV